MTAIALTLVVTFTALGSPLAGTLVLCIGSDGHADLEIALGECCVDEPPSRVDGVGGEDSTLVDPCGGCADIELDTTPLIKHKHRLHPPQLPEISVPSQIAAWVASFAETDPSGGSVPPHLADLATVVLLT